MTLEDETFQALSDFYASKRAIEVHSAHPPSGKTYQSALVRLPAKQPKGASSRYHIDFVFQIGTLLVLQELKGRSSESAADIDKLRTILRDYTLAELGEFLRPRVARPEKLEDATHVVPSLGFSELDSILPDDFVCFEAGTAGVKIIVGKLVPSNAADICKAL